MGPVMSSLRGCGKSEARAAKLEQSQMEVADIVEVVVRLEVTLPAIGRVELPLNDQIGVIWPDGSNASTLGSSVSNETW
jgi:hypothetical protein